jgi:5-hydroxyisourate hydrolase-like protein (transthyretin family)
MLTLRLLAITAGFLAAACSAAETIVPEEPEPEMLSRTEFTDRIENFFEYAPLKSGQSSPFLIHLTDLSDGSPVEKAEVTLVARREGTDGAITQTKAQVGRVTGIYVAQLTVPEPGNYALEFHIKNSNLDERMVLRDFTVE